MLKCIKIIPIQHRRRLTEKMNVLNRNFWIAIKKKSFDISWLNYSPKQVVFQPLIVLPILTGKMNWKEARDIALIALYSYPTQARLSRQTLVFFAFPLLLEVELYQLAFVLL